MVTLGEMKPRSVNITLYCQPNEGPGCYHATTSSMAQLIQYFGVDFDISASREIFLRRFVCQKCGRRFATMRMGQGTDAIGINSAAGSHDHGPHISIEEATSRYHELEAERRRLGIKSNAELNADRGPSCGPPRKPNALVPGLSVRRTLGHIESWVDGFEVAAHPQG